MQTDWSQFFGRFHPLTVHLPIGIILFAVLLCAVAVFKKNAFLNYAINLALLTGSVGAMLAAVSGYLLSLAGGYHANTLFWHQWAGIAAAIICFISWILRRKNPAQIGASNLCLLFATILIAIGGHLGGSMTHGEGYLSAHLPAFLKQFFGSQQPVMAEKRITSIDSVVVYRDIVQPILNNKCISCHNPGKQKGELDLSTKEGILKGGKSGDAIVPADLEKSEIFHRVTLPVTSSKFMPADNQPALTTVEISMIKWWINAAAEYDKNLAALNTDDKSKYLIAAYLGIDAENAKEIILPEVVAADSAVLKQLKETGIIIRPLSSASNLLQASFVMVQQADEHEITKLLEKLSAVKEQLYQLDIKHCTLSNNAMQLVGNFKRLHKLDLQRTKLSDEMITSLVNLQHLAILNIGENGLSDKSFTILKELKELKKVNLWQTKVTEDGIANFKTGNNNIIVEW